MGIGRALSQEFLSEAEDLLYLVLSYGIENVKDPLKSKERYLEFTAAVHDGWKQAQLRIAALLIAAIARRDAARDQKAIHRRKKDKAREGEASNAVDLADMEIAILRRIMDVVLWTICGGDHSMMRRLFVIGGHSNFSAKNIEDALPVAASYNKDRYQVALCTDMLSYVHVGDLLVSDAKSGTITFVEIKTGEKNMAITRAVNFALDSECGLFEHLTTEQLSQVDRAQYNRVKRQAIRNQTIVDTVRNEGGTDPNTGAIVSVLKTDDPPMLWSDRIVSCYRELSDSKPWSIASIDECVHLGVYNRRDMAFVGFNSWMDRLKCTSPIFNLTDSFRDPSVRPLGATFLPIELQNKILRGDVLVIICLDYERLFQMSNKMHDSVMRSASRRETSEAKRHKLRMLEFNGRLIEMRIGDNALYLGAGFRDRVIFDQHCPSQLVSQNIAQLLSGDGQWPSVLSGSAGASG